MILSITFAMQRQLFADRKAGNDGVDRRVLAADLVRSVGLGVEAVVVREAAAEIDEDDRLGPLTVLLRTPLGFCLQQGGQGEPGQSERPDAKEVAAGGAIAGASGAAWEHDVEHRVWLRASSARAAGEG